MKGSPIHQNLTTSFVDLSMLVSFLRDRHFTGSIRVEWEGYDGEIFFTGSPRLHAREYDRSIGRIAQGQNAFRRILQRARRPSGKIYILKNDADQTTEVLRKPFVDERILAKARSTAFGRSDQPAPFLRPVLPTKLPSVGQKTRAALLATDLLLSFKQAFERSRISFDTAFAVACGLKACEYPFLEPDNEDFSFFKDEIFIGDKIGSVELFEGITAALCHIITRLTEERRLQAAAVYLRHRLHLHLSERNNDYRDLQLTSIVDQLLR